MANLFSIHLADSDVVHTTENNIGSQHQLDKYRVHFNTQCRQVFNLLMNGTELNSRDGVTVYGILDTKRRIKELRDWGVLISDRAILNSHGAKQWFMTETDKIFNKQFQN